MNPETNDATTFDTDNNIIYTDNLLTVEYNNNSYYHNHIHSMFDYIRNYIADNLRQIIYDDTENNIALNVSPVYDYTTPPCQEYMADQELFITIPTAAESDVEEPDYSMLVCCICDNLLVDRYITCCDACQREYVKIKSLDNYKY